MPFVDTHSHLYTEDFDADRHQAVERAKKAGVAALLLPNIDSHSIDGMMNLYKDFPNYAFPMMGLHPTELGDDYHAVLAEMKRMLEQSQHPFIAIGEVGLDFYWDESQRTQQYDAFVAQLEWAITYHLPLMIHCRNAQHELMNLMNPYKKEGLTGVFHCFGGSEDEACELLEWDGFCLGIGGILTYKKSKLPKVLLDNAPLTRIVLETDSPYLAPVPNRGRRNESAFVAFTLHKLAQTYGVDTREVERITTNNVLRVFKRLSWGENGFLSLKTTR